MQPFHKVLAQAIGQNIGSLLNYPNGDFGRVARRIIEGTEQYYECGGERLLLDESKPWTAFHVFRGMTPNTRAPKFSCTGFDADSEMSFVLFGYLDNIEQDNAWTCISAFDRDDVIYKGSSAENTFTGYAAFRRVTDNPVEIARKYGLQVDKVERRQTEIVALEIEYILTLKDAKKKGELLTFVLDDGSSLTPSFPSTCCPQNNLNANRLPTANDDYSEGYRIGSEWVYNGEVYYLTDATTGAAVWENMTFSIDELDLSSYYTKVESDARFAAISHTHDWAEITGKPTIPSTTDDISEGSNLYFTDERVDDRVSNLLAEGNGITLTYDDVGNSLTIDSLIRVDSDNNFIVRNGGTSLVPSDGTNNTFIGNNSGNGITTGDNNLVIGNDSLTSGTSSDECVILGDGNNPDGGTPVNNAFIVGKDITYDDDGEINIQNIIRIKPFQQIFAFGTDAAGDYVLGNTAGFFLGDEAGRYCNADGWICIGNNAGKGDSNAGSSGEKNVFIGDDAGRFINGSAEFNFFMGAEAGRGVEDGSYNVLLGAGAGKFIVNGSYNIAIGTFTGENLADGQHNTFIGYSSGEDNAGDNNTFIGYKSGERSSGSGNIFIGYEAGQDELGDNKLYIANSDTSDPLIYGEFDNELVKVNGRLRITDNSETPVAGDMRYNSSTSKHEGYDGTSWNAFY